MTLPDEMEAEKNRKIILAQADKIEILEKNVYDLQKQLQEAYKKIGNRETVPIDRNYRGFSDG